MERSLRVRGCRASLRCASRNTGAYRRRVQPMLCGCDSSACTSLCSASKRRGCRWSSPSDAGHGCVNRLCEVFCCRGHPCNYRLRCRRRRRCGVYAANRRMVRGGCFGCGECSSDNPLPYVGRGVCRQEFRGCFGVHSRRACFCRICASRRVGGHRG